MMETGERIIELFSESITKSVENFSPNRKARTDLSQRRDEALNKHAILDLSIKRTRQEINNLEHQISKLQKIEPIKISKSKDITSQEDPCQIFMKNQLNGDDEFFLNSFNQQKKVAVDIVDSNFILYEDTPVEIRDLNRFGNIQFSLVTNQFLPSEDGNFVRRCKLRGVSYELPFAITFDTDFHTPQKPKIHRVQVEVRPDLRAQLKPLIDWVEAQKNIQTFFTSFEKFAKNYRRRKEMFLYFKAKYNCVGLMHGQQSSGLQFTSIGDCASISFDFSWKIYFIEGKASVVKELIPRFSQDFLDTMKSQNPKSDPLKLVAEFRSNFNKLVSTKGLKPALKQMAQLALKQAKK